VLWWIARRVDTALGRGCTLHYVQVLAPKDTIVRQDRHPGHNFFVREDDTVTLKGFPTQVALEHAVMSSIVHPGKHKKSRMFMRLTNGFAGL
jgi:hypothetical protein